MPEHIKALCVVLGLCGAASMLLFPVLSPALVSRRVFRRRLVAWFGVLITAFLAGNFWLFIAFAAIITVLVRKNEPNPPALLIFLMWAVPEVAGKIPAIGGIDHLFFITWPRLLALALLLPTAWHLLKARDARKVDTADVLVGAYIVLQIVLYLEAYGNITDALRKVITLSLDLLLPYFVASRAVRDLHSLRDCLASLVLAALLMAPVAAFEYYKHWLLYTPLPQALGVFWDGSAYLTRGDNLRATASAGHSLVLGCVLAIALTIHSALRRHYTALVFWGISAALAVGLVSTVSRGPWIGAAIGVFVVNATGHGKTKRMLRLAGFSFLVAALSLLSPWSSSIIDHLPFVGSVDADNVTYRQRLLDVGLLVASQNPWFGTPAFLSNPAMEQMRQGQGIIDIVNVYLDVALGSGIVGLGIFCSLFALALWHVRMALASGARQPEDASEVSRALFGALVALMVMIGGIGSIFAVPLLCIYLVGLASAYGRLANGNNALASAKPFLPVDAVSGWSARAKAETAL